jgi:hypothetical protein
MKRSYGTVFAVLAVFSVYLTSGQPYRSSAAAPRGTVKSTPATQKSRGSKGPILTAQSNCDESANVAANGGKPDVGDNSPPCLSQLDDLIAKYCDEDTPDKTGNSKEGDNSPPCPNQPDVLIALVPDPAHTHLAVFYDRAMDAIQWAAGQNGYLYARSYTPWNEWPWKSYTAAGTSPSEVRDEEKEEEHGEKNPGLIIFREFDQETKNEKTLLVYVVGESPTGGINPGQFYAALHHIGKAGKKKEEAPTGKQKPKPGTKKKRPSAKTKQTQLQIHNLRILGPYFSGSLYSLRNLLTTANNPNSQDLSLPQVAHFDVYSGTVTSATTIAEVRLPHATFLPFQHSDAYTSKALLDYLKTLGYRPSRVAFLNEDESAYGVSLQNNGNGSSSTDPCKPPDHHEQQPLTLYFPREISQLRDAYQRNLAQAAAGSEAPPPDQNSLPLNLQTTGTNDDTIREMGGFPTTLSQEAVLQEITAAFRQHQIQFIVLKATDPMDELFLTRYFRKAYPSARVITTDADLLFPRGSQDTSLLGTMAVSTYPPLPDTEQYACETHPCTYGVSQHDFPDAHSVGIYNAILALLAAPACRCHPPEECAKANPIGKSCTDLCGKLPPADYVQYGGSFLGDDLAKPPSGNSGIPSLWLSVLGHNQYWPIAALDTADNKPTQDLHKAGDYPQNNPSPSELLIPPLWQALCYIGLVLSLFYFVLIITGSRWSKSRSVAYFAAFDRKRKVWLGLAAGFLLSLWIWATALPLSLWRLTRPPNFRISVSLLLLAGVLIVLGGIALVQRWAFSEPFPSVAWRCCFYSVIVISLFVGSDAVWQFFHPGFGKAFTRATAIRWLNVDSGVSLLLPIIFLIGGLLWWIWQSMSGFVLFDKHRPRLLAQLPAGLKPFFRLTEKNNEKLLSLVKLSFTNPRLWIPALLGLLLLYMVAAMHGDLFHPLQTLELQSWPNVLYPALLVAAIFLLFSTVLRLSLVWQECSYILFSLNLLPLRRAFLQLKGFSWGVLKIRGVDSEDLYRLLVRELDTLQQLSVATGLDSPDCSLPVAERALAFSVEQVLSHRKSLLEDLKTTPPKFTWSKLWHFGNGFDDDSEWVRMMCDIKCLQVRISVACGAALLYLSKKWAEEPTSCLFQVEGSSDTQSDKPPVEIFSREVIKNAYPRPATCLAERFVCLAFLNFILAVLHRIRTLILAIGGLYVFILLSLTTYPFEPRIAIKLFLFCLFLLVVGTVGMVYAGMHRDATLSHVTDTKPGKLDLQFYLHIASFVAIPLFGLITSFFPQINDFLFSWVQPAVNAFK